MSGLKVVLTSALTSHRQIIEKLQIAWLGLARLELHSRGICFIIVKYIYIQTASPTIITDGEFLKILNGNRTDRPRVAREWINCLSLLIRVKLLRFCSVFHLMAQHCQNWFIFGQQIGSL